METKEIINEIIDATVELYKDNPNSDAIQGVALSLMWLENLLEPTEYTPASLFYMLIQTKIKEYGN